MMRETSEKQKKEIAEELKEALIAYCDDVEARKKKEGRFEKMFNDWMFGAIMFACECRIIDSGCAKDLFKKYGMP